MALSLDRAKAAKQAKTVEPPPPPKVKEQLTAFHDKFVNHFLGEDAEKVAKVLGLEGDLDTLADGTTCLQVHRQEWNLDLPKLIQAGYEVLVTDM